MKKDELVELHETFQSIKQLLEESGKAPEGAFEEYERLNITPAHDHKTKKKHRLAIFTLGSEISDVISDADMSDADTIGNRMDELADNTAEKITEDVA